MSKKALEVVLMPLEKLKADPKNARTHNKKNLEAIAASLRQFGQQKNLVVLEDGTVIAGNGTLEAAKLLGWKELAATVFKGTAREATAFAIADNRSAELAEWDFVTLSQALEDFGDEFDVGFTPEEIEKLLDLGGEGSKGEASRKLAELFGVPPFTVLDARQGYWQERKRAWLALGIRSEEGRGENLLGYSDTVLEPDREKRLKINEQGYDGGNAFSGSGTSIFDPMLCELVYRWFCPKGGLVLDPFAGGSVRGIVAARLGLKYFGVDLREDQVKANRKQAEEILEGKDKPEWKAGDSRDLKKLFKGRADFLFSCPPYFDLEKYSKDERDLSSMTWEQFKAFYAGIIKAGVESLADDSFACFVVGDIRDKAGLYRGLPSLTIECFEAAGAKLYNEAVFVTPVGSLSIRVGRIFKAGRKLGKTHQNVLVFFKGDPKRIKERFGTEIEFGEAPEEDHADA